MDEWCVLYGACFGTTPGQPIHWYLLKRACLRVNEWVRWARGWLYGVSWGWGWDGGYQCVAADWMAFWWGGWESSSVFCFLAACKKNKVCLLVSVEAGTLANPPQALYHKGDEEVLVTSEPVHPDKPPLQRVCRVPGPEWKWLFGVWCSY